MPDRDKRLGGEPDGWVPDSPWVTPNNQEDPYRNRCPRCETGTIQNLSQSLADDAEWGCDLCGYRLGRDEPAPWGSMEGVDKVMPGTNIPVIRHEDDSKWYWRNKRKNKEYPLPGRLPADIPMRQGCAHTFSEPVRSRRGSVATCLRCGVTKGKTAIVGLPTFYHVAPAHLRDEIAKQGLIGHLGEGTSSPWDERRKQWMTPVQQPAGNYFFSNLDDARDYAVQQGLTEHKLEHPDHYPYEHRIVPPEPPEDFHDWDMEDQDNWYEEHPGEEATGPHQLYNTYKGHDIWAVDPTGLHLKPDPEMALLHGEIPDEESAIEAIRDQSYGRDEDTPEGTNWQEWEYQGGRSPDRWMTPEYVPPEAIQHHEWVPPWAANEQESMNRLEEYGDRQLPQKSPLHERETPEPFHQMPQRPLPDWSEG